MQRRTVLGLVGGTLLPLAGCLRRTGTASPDDPLVRSGPGDYPHDIYAHNASDRDVSLTLAVDRGSTALYRDSHTVPADTGEVIAGITRETLPESDRRLAVTATLSDGQSSRVEVVVTACLGSVDFSIDTNGELGSTYAIC